MATARAINVWPTWEILMDAELIHPEPNEPGRRINLTSVIQEAIQRNLALAVQGQFVATGLQEVRKARANLFPQLQIGAQALAIDKDRARASFGSQAEHTVSGSARFSQILFSEDIRANLDIQKLQQAARQYELEQLKLDIAQEAAVAYLNVLRARTFLQIQRENLELTRSNLELARLRQDIGSSGPAEVYRWENKIATDKKNLLSAQTRLTLAEYALNRLLNRPLEDAVRTAETSIEDPNLLVCREELIKHVQTPHQLRVVGDFFVQQGMASAFEIKQIDAAIAAQKRNQEASKRR
jgi:outer membrane protein TolC